MTLRFTPSAFLELEAIFTYLVDRSPQGASKVMIRIHAILDFAAKHPQIGLPTGRRGLRRLTVRPYPYLIFYQVSHSGVVVHGIRHAARHPETMPT